MRKIILSGAMIMAIGLSSCNGEKKTVNEIEEKTVKLSQEIAMKDASFGVRGNCGMCKTTIERAANAVNGVESADWDVEKKKIDITYNDSVTDIMKIHNAIAASGYDTEKVNGNKEAYENLPGCCKYDHNMKMNQSVDETPEDHANHNH